MDLADVGIRLTQLGVAVAKKDNEVAMEKYARQLEHEADAFGRPEKRESGRAIRRMLALGKRDETGG